MRGAYLQLHAAETEAARRDATQQRRNVLTHNEIVLFHRSLEAVCLFRFSPCSKHVPYHGYQSTRCPDKSSIVISQPNVIIFPNNSTKKSTAYPPTRSFFVTRTCSVTSAVANKFIEIEHFAVRTYSNLLFFLYILWFIRKKRNTFTGKRKQCCKYCRNGNVHLRNARCTIYFAFNTFDQAYEWALTRRGLNFP